MKYKIKVGNKYLMGESANETLKFCDNIEDADAKDAVTACDYVRGIMERQNCGFYLGEIKLIDADALVDSFDPSDFWNPDAEDNCFAAIHVVNCAPTIIEAELPVHHGTFAATSEQEALKRIIPAEEGEI